MAQSMIFFFVCAMPFLGLTAQFSETCQVKRKTSSSDDTNCFCIFLWCKIKTLDEREIKRGE